MFFFYFNRKHLSLAHQIDPQSIIRRLMPYSTPDKSGLLTDDGGSLLIQCVHWNTARSRLEPAPFYHAPSKTVAASWARLDNREELAEKMAIDPKEIGKYCDTELILFSYLKWQEACVDHLIGDFVFVIHDRQNKKIFCGRDHMGVRPFYYFASDDVFVCTTSLAALLRLECVPICIEQQWVAEYLVHLSGSFDRTPYEGIKKLPPAHCLAITPNQIQMRQYFTLSAEPALRLKDSREYVDAYREQLEAAIKCRLDSDYAIGSELSGGIDSSTITAFAARSLNGQLSRLHTFAFAFLEQEPAYIASVIQACHLPNNHIFAQAEKASPESIQRSLDILGYPVEHPNATFHEPFYRLAEKLDIRTLLSGFGGDEFCTTIHGYLVPREMLMQQRFRELFDILPGNALFRFLRLIKMELMRRKTANFTMPAYNPRMYKTSKLRWSYHIVQDELIRQYNLEERYIDKARFDAGYTDLKRFTLERRWRPFVPTRMENCTLMAAGRKIEYRWPLLDIRMVRLFLSIPSKENYYRSMGRYLHRRSIDGIVPKMITWKKNKEMGAAIRSPGHEAQPFDHISILNLHPALAAYIDTEGLRRQIATNDPDSMAEKAMIYQAIRYTTTWMKHLEQNTQEHPCESNEIPKKGEEI